MNSLQNMNMNVQFNSVQFSSVQFSSVQFSSIQFSLITLMFCKGIIIVLFIFVTAVP